MASEPSSRGGLGGMVHGVTFRIDEAVLWNLNTHHPEKSASGQEICEARDSKDETKARDETRPLCSAIVFEYY